MKNKSTQKSYFFGFVLSVILTIIPFYITAHNTTKNTKMIATIIVACAIIQIFIHLICFLHVGNTTHQTWNLISLLFTVLIISILVFGSIWIMQHLHHNLMISMT